MFRIAILVGLLMTPASSHAQAPPSLAWPSMSSWVARQTAKCGEVHGRIVRWPSGAPSDSVAKPMEGAFVKVGLEIPPIGVASSGAVLGDPGEFTARLDTSRVTLVIAKAIGYFPATIALDNAIAKSYVVEIMMRYATPEDSEKGLTLYSVRAISPCTP